MLDAEETTHEGPSTEAQLITSEFGIPEFTEAEQREPEIEIEITSDDLIRIFLQS